MGSWACLELPDTAISCVRWDTTSTPLLSLASVMFWQLTEEAGGGGKVRKDFKNFPSTSEIVLQQHKPTVDWLPIRLGCVSQVGNTLNRRWKVAWLKQLKYMGLITTWKQLQSFPHLSLLCKRELFSAGSGQCLSPWLTLDCKASTSVIRLRASNNSCICSLN